VRDLSPLARNALTVTSQDGGNMVHDNSPAQTAPGSAPVTPLPAADHMPDPNLDVGAERPVGTPAARRPHGSYSPSSASWKTVSEDG
jgi:hypothetical protein